MLIDTGTGTSQMFGPKLGHLLANLRASGYSAEQVEEIYVIESAGERMLAWGDLMHVAALQFPLPSVDLDRSTARSKSLAGAPRAGSDL